MMINTLLISKEQGSLRNLSTCLTAYCPQIGIRGTAASPEEAQCLLQAGDPDLVFMDLELLSQARTSIPERFNGAFETILLHPGDRLPEQPMLSAVVGYLFLPLQLQELLNTVSQAAHRIRLKHEWGKCRRLLSQLHCQSPPHNLIGIPAMEGMEFLKVEEIVRCEGLQQFTRVVVSGSPGIISSYNIGKFRDLLLPYGFFASHKSHLINLQHLRRYTMDGVIQMRDGSVVPVSRRRRSAFLERVRHL